MELDVTLKVILIITSMSFLLFIVFVMILLYFLYKKIIKIDKHIEILFTDISQTLHYIDESLKSLGNDLRNSLDNFNHTSAQIKSTANELETGLKGVNSVVKIYKNLAFDLQNKITRPVSGVAGYISAITKAVSTFKSFFKK